MDLCRGYRRSSFDRSVFSRTIYRWKCYASTRCQSGSDRGGYSDAADGTELWSRVFDRELKDIFAVQTEIAQAVAASLELTLLGSKDTTAANASTQSVQAHNAYLQGHFYFARRNLEDYRKAISFFDQAIRLDPDYALAYAERSE